MILMKGMCFTYSNLIFIALLLLFYLYFIKVKLQYERNNYNKNKKNKMHTCCHFVPTLFNDL